MHAYELLQTLQAGGYRLESVAGKIRCQGAARVPDELAAAVREQRDELGRLLACDAPNVIAIAGEGANKFNRLELVGLLDRATSNPEVPTEDGPRGGRASTCYCCGGTRHWRLRDGCPWVCARCHPCDEAAAMEVSDA